MLQRGQGARFMPGVWVFAGGGVDPEDRETSFSPAGADREEAAHRVCAARELHEEASLIVDPATLRPWSRWITPEPLPIRFDTRFYVGPAPRDDKPTPDFHEIDAARWIAPAVALDEFASGSFQLPYPTLKHVEELSAYGSAAAVLAGTEGREVEAVTPGLPSSEEAKGMPSFPDGPSFSD